jgi:hypothetical protein
VPDAHADPHFVLVEVAESIGGEKVMPAPPAPPASAAAGARTETVRAAARAPAALDVWRRGKDAPSIGAGKTRGIHNIVVS